jgi:hypothetical protein
MCVDTLHRGDSGGDGDDDDDDDNQKKNITQTQTHSPLNVFFLHFHSLSFVVSVQNLSSLSI